MNSGSVVPVADNTKAVVPDWEKAYRAGACSSYANSVLGSVVNTVNTLETDLKNALAEVKSLKSELDSTKKSLTAKSKLHKEEQLKNAKLLSQLGSQTSAESPSDSVNLYSPVLPMHLKIAKFLKPPTEVPRSGYTLHYPDGIKFFKWVSASDYYDHIVSVESAWRVLFQNKPEAKEDDSYDTLK